MAETATALVVGASRGLGLGLVREYLAGDWRVIATHRGEPGEALAALAREAGGRLLLEELEMTDDAAIAALRGRLAGEKLDLLFVNAGISHDRERPIGAVSLEDFTRLMTTNALAPMRIVELFADLVRPQGTIVAMSSILGSVASNTTGRHEVYRASKAALNTLLRSFSARNADRSIVVMHPGWVRTDMGGPEADIGIEESVPGMVATVAARAGRPGCVYLDYRGQTVPW